MAGSPTGEGPRNGNGGKGRNDLTRIEGIGDTKAQWLRSIGIVTIQDLACASPDYLESTLKAEGHVTGRDEEKKWIAQARILVDKASRQTAPRSAASNLESAASNLESTASNLNDSLNSAAEESGSSQSFEAPDADDETIGVDVSETADPAEPKLESEVDAKTLINPSPDTAEWGTFASFAVEFQDRQVENRTEQRTLVRHVETDTVESWSSIEGERFKRWILSQATQARPPGPVTATATPVAPKISQVRIFQPPEMRLPVLVTQAESRVANSIRQQEPFSLEVAFDLIDDGLAVMAAKHATYHVQWDAKNLAPPHEIISLEDSKPQPVVADQTFYTICLPEVSLQAGIYRLQILITLQGVATIPTFFDALVLQVV